MYSGHNCTNYVAYRMITKGVTRSPWGLPGGSAWQWRANAKKAKIKVDTVPTVGAVIQWNRYTYGGGSSGHVAYVESVSRTSIVISEDSWSGHGAVRTIRRDSPSFTSARFIHIKDGGSN
nr:CHAP domain-containing protein [Microlunatus panaciterrae]